MDQDDLKLYADHIKALKENGNTLQYMDPLDVERYSTALINIVTTTTAILSEEFIDRATEDLRLWSSLSDEVKLEIYSQPPIMLAIEQHIEAQLKAEIFKIRTENEEMRRQIEYYTAASTSNNRKNG